jgi:hypothetical protein
LHRKGVCRSILGARYLGTTSFVRIIYDIVYIRGLVLRRYWIDTTDVIAE